ncbi:MAG: hypothetical protein AAB473_00035 [Patescibacteria group bacterium]
MIQRKFFTLEPDEEFLGVIRPSLWLLTPRILSALVLIVFPFAFWSSLLYLGVLFGGLLAAISLVIGTTQLRDTRRQYLENGIYITSRRAIDVHAKRKSFHATELSWNVVEKIVAMRKGFSSMIGYGHVCIRGADEDGFSLIVGPVWKPDLVIGALPKVQ